MLELEEATKVPGYELFKWGAKARVAFLAGDWLPTRSFPSK